MSLHLPASMDAAAYARRFNDDVWRQAAALICARHALPYVRLRRSSVGENVIFFVADRFVVKIFAPARDQSQREPAALEFAHGKLAIATPEVLHTGEIEGWAYLVMTQLVGRPAREVWAELTAHEQLEIVSCLGRAMHDLHAHAAPSSPAARARDWPDFVAQQARAAVARQSACGANPEWLASLPAYIAARLHLLPTQFNSVLLHGDVHLGNMLLSERGGHWQVTGLFDFGDSFCGYHEYEFVAPGVLMVQGRRELQRAMLGAYGYSAAELDLTLRARLMLLTILYECSDLRKYALRLAPDAVALTLAELEAAIWTFTTA